MDSEENSMYCFRYGTLHKTKCSLRSISWRTDTNFPAKPFRLTQSTCSPIAVSERILHSLRSFSLQHKDRVLAAQQGLRGEVLQLWKGPQGPGGCKDVIVRGIVPEGSDSPCCLILLPLGTAEVPAVLQRGWVTAACALEMLCLPVPTEQDGHSRSYWAPSAGSCQVLPSSYLV